AVEGYGTDAKMAPPLRTRADVDALRAALADGTIDAIATDHAPHHRDEKTIEFEHAAFGIVGLETALPLSLRLLERGVLRPIDLVRRMSTIPAEIIGVNGGRLRPGDVADVAIVDPTLEWRVEGAGLR